MVSLKPLYERCGQWTMGVLNSLVLPHDSAKSLRECDPFVSEIIKVLSDKYRPSAKIPPEIFVKAGLVVMKSGGQPFPNTVFTKVEIITCLLCKRTLWLRPLLLYRPETGQVIYYGRQRGRGGDAEASPARIFPALDFLAALCTHVPDSGQQLVRYYGAFSNARRVSPGAPASASAPSASVHSMQQDGSDRGPQSARERRRSWARLIKKVYEADPLVCPRCLGPLKIISLIGDGPVIEKILRHLKLWDRPERPPPCPAEPSIHYDKENVDLDEAGQWPDATA
jgi:hypothetical protein